MDEWDEAEEGEEPEGELMWVSAAVWESVCVCGGGLFSFASAALTAVCLHQRGSAFTQLLAPQTASDAVSDCLSSQC